MTAVIYYILGFLTASAAAALLALLLGSRRSRRDRSRADSDWDAFLRY